MSQIAIQSRPAAGMPPYSHLEPLVEFLIERGNKINGPTRWRNTPSGWLCSLLLPIDAGILRRDVVLPPSIQFDEGNNAVGCQLTWCTIMGGTVQSAA